MGISLRPAADFSRAAIAELFTASYEGYFVPMKIDEATATYMVEVFDLDPAASLVAVDSDEPVGLANLGRRDGRTWLGGIGVVPGRRGQGIGELLNRALLDRARGLGATEMALEVIVENAPAIALYEKLGFEHVRDLDVLSLPAAEGGGNAEQSPVDAARAIVTGRRDAPEPWQRADETLAHLADRDPPLQALVADGAAAIFRMSGPAVNLVQAAGDEEGLREIVSELRARGPVSAVNYPAGGVVSTVLQAAGADVALRQHEMVLPL